MTTLTFNATGPAITVVLSVDDYRDDATEHAANATRAATQADEALRGGREAAKVVPATFRTDGGADAAYVVSLLAEIADEVHEYARLAREAAVAADAAEDTDAAREAAEAAASHDAAAWWEADSATRIAFPLGLAAAYARD